MHDPCVISLVTLFVPYVVVIPINLVVGEYQAKRLAHSASHMDRPLAKFLIINGLLFVQIIDEFILKVYK